MKRFCKGCEENVTDTMWCHCGEFSLNEKSTYTEAELIARDEAIEAIEKPPQLAQTFVNGCKVAERVIRTEAEYTAYLREISAVHPTCSTEVHDIVTPA